MAYECGPKETNGFYKHVHYALSYKYVSLHQ